MFKFFDLFSFYMDVAENEGGSSGDEKPEPVTVDWTKVDPASIPEDLVNKHPAHVKVVNESIDRRKKIAALNKQIGELNPGEDTQDTAKKPDQSATEDIPAWAKTIIDEFKTLKTTNVSTWRENAGKATGLKGTVLNSLDGVDYNEVLTKAKTIATELGIAAPSADISAGNPAAERDKGFQTKVRNKILNKDAVETFDPEFQRSLGGGVFLPD